MFCPIWMYRYYTHTVIDYDNRRDRRDDRGSERPRSDRSQRSERDRRAREWEETPSSRRGGGNDDGISTPNVHRKGM